VAGKIIIVGCGPGSAEYVTPAALRAVARARVLVGAERLLALFPSVDAERIVVKADIEDIVDQIAVKARESSVAVLVSGDPGVFSLSGRVIERFGRHACEVIPGVSSIQTAFARIGLDWADARIISAHKENPASEIADSLRDEDKIAVLAGRPGAIQWIVNIAEELGRDRRIFVCEDLTLETEKIREIGLEDLTGMEAGSRTILLIIKRNLVE
jgi:cobalt-precorrin-7 (C5)-methyltransferase